MRAAQKYAARKKAKQSSSSSGSGTSSTSTTSDEGLLATEGVFSEETKTKAIGDRYPGALALETLMLMRQSLLARGGRRGANDEASRALVLRNILGRPPGHKPASY